ncbi:type I restriction endonuclease subunit S, partial [Candidatus Borkfalkia ceftriaxoniphila]
MKAEQLRKSILQLAIQGKLVPQNPNDEPASVLLERIRAEKQQLIKEGKIKKDKVDSVIFKGDDNRHYEKVGNEIKDITEEIDFELPDGWEY